MTQMTAQQPNRQILTAITNSHSYPVTALKNEHRLQDDNAARPQSNIYTDSAAIF